MVHEVDHYSYVYKIIADFLSIALKQPKARPQSLGTSVLVFIDIYSSGQLISEQPESIYQNTLQQE